MQATGRDRDGVVTGTCRRRFGRCRDSLPLFRFQLVWASATARSRRLKNLQKVEDFALTKWPNPLSCSSRQ